MDKITLHRVLPEAFAGRGDLSSGVWLREAEFEKGKTYLVEAASGTGKSSLCSFVYGYRRDYRGQILFDGEDVRRFPVSRWVDLRRCSLSMLFQELRLFPELTARENVRLKNALTGHCAPQQVGEWFERLGIADKLDQPVGRMSFGQQQRVAFVRALCQPFDFIFLDEPVSHLDSDNGRVMAAILTEEARRQGAGVVVTSIGRRLETDYDETLRL